MSDKLGSARSNPVSLPEANIFTVTLFLFLLFLKMQTCTLTFFYSFIFFFFSLSSLSVFFCLYSPRAFVSLSGIQSKEIHLVSLYLSVFLFYSYAFSTHVLFPLLHCYTFLHNGVSSVCPSTSPSHFKLIPFPRISSPSHPRRLTQR